MKLEWTAFNAPPDDRQENDFFGEEMEGKGGGDCEHDIHMENQGQNAGGYVTGLI